MFVRKEDKTQTFIDPLEKIQHCHTCDRTLVSLKNLQGGFFNWSALKMTKCQITCKLDPVGSTVRYEMMKLCTGSV